MSTQISSKNKAYRFTAWLLVCTMTLAPVMQAHAAATALSDNPLCGMSAAVAVSNARLSSTDNFVFVSGFDAKDWTGELQKFAIDVGTGKVNTTALWDPSAQARLDTMTPDARKIATYSGSAGKPFQWASLTAAQKAKLHTPVTPPGPADGAEVLQYLRGERGQEDAVYRKRAHLLGDIVNAEPVFVGKPMANYADAGYAQFKADQAERAGMVYQGANDGMLHAFSASTGAEEWAYVPDLVMGNLNNLSRKNGFVHKFYVDGTPTMGDVDFSKTSSVTGKPNPDWHTLLVGGVRKGGKGYFALDITTASAANEASVAAKVLWEFPNAATAAAVIPHIGYSYGKPVIVKTENYGWVVLVSSGYNNGTDTGGDGKGYLFVLDAKTGALIKEIPTTAGTPATPSGLAQISAYVEDGNVDNTTDYVYAGDLLGNVWRFNLKGTSAQWKVAKLATLLDANGKAQPVTTAPELGRIGDHRMVYVGTGRYLAPSDAPNTDPQSFYGLKDDLASEISPLRTSLVQQTFIDTGDKRTITSHAVELSTKKGWFFDYPSAGERSYTQPALVFGALVFTTNVPPQPEKADDLDDDDGDGVLQDEDECGDDGASFFYTVDYTTGSAMPNTSQVGFELNDDDDGVGASRPVVVKLPGGKIVGLTNGAEEDDDNDDLAKGVTSTTVGGLANSGNKRLTWREIINP